MPRNYKRELGSREYRNYSADTLIKAVEAVKRKELSLRKAASKYGIHRNTLWLKIKEKTPGKVGRPQALLEAEEETIVAHLIAMSTYGFPLTTFDLRMVVKAYLNRLGKKCASFKNNTPGRDWCSLFLQRHREQLSQRMAKNISHNRAATNEEMLREFFSHYKDECEGVPPQNVWNYDETNLVDDPGAKSVITARGAKYPERIRNASKACTSIMACCNAAGDFAPLYVCYKADHIWTTWTENGPPHTRYNRTSSGWFDFVTFEDWFTSLMLPILKKIPGKKILIGDNLSSHINPTVLRLGEQENIRFIALPPNATHLLQPLDVAVFKSMKLNWRAVLDEWKETSAGSRCLSVPKDTFPSLLKQLLGRMEPTLKINCQSGFRKTGLYPFEPEQPISRLPSYVLAEQSRSSLISGLISQTFIDHIEEKRTQLTQPLRKKRKRVIVVPGKSVSFSDVMEPLEDGGSQRKKPAGRKEKNPSSSKPTKKKSASTSRSAVVMSDDDSSCSNFSIPYEESDHELFNPDDDSDFQEFDQHDGANPTHLQEILVQPQSSSSLEDQGQRESTEPLKTAHEGSSRLHDPPAVIDRVSDIVQPSSSGAQLLEPSDVEGAPFRIGQYVVVSYNDELYPGQITAVLPGKIKFNSMARKGMNWIWPARKDETDFEVEDVCFEIQPPIQISRREIYNVPELRKMLF